MKTGYIEQLMQIFNGATWDGNLVCKSYRDELQKCGLVKHVLGWNIITEKGARYVIELGLIKQ